MLGNMTCSFTISPEKAKVLLKATEQVLHKQNPTKLTEKKLFWGANNRNSHINKMWNVVSRDSELLNDVRCEIKKETSTLTSSLSSCFGGLEVIGVTHGAEEDNCQRHQSQMHSPCCPVTLGPACRQTDHSWGAPFHAVAGGTKSTTAGRGALGWRPLPLRVRACLENKP